MSDPEQTVQRRRVFYIPGYDPFPPRRYRELFRREGADQARLSGYRLSLRPKQGQGPFGWHVRSRIDGAETRTEFSVLVWSDIVAQSMAQGVLATYGQLARTAWVYIGSGALFRLMRLRKGPILAAFYPVAMLLAQLALACLAGVGVAAALSHLLPLWLALPGGLAMAAGFLRLFRRNDHRFFAYYLMHDFAFSARGKGAYGADLEARLAAFRHEIAAALQEDLDEVLVVGHSSGAHLAISVLADLLRSGADTCGSRPARPAQTGPTGLEAAPPDRPALSLLTLGQAVPMVSFLPRAGRLRSDLHFLSASGELTWVDVSAPGDGCSFALCDPVAVSGVAPADKRWPLVLSAAFTHTLSPARWKALRWRFFRLHFQYMCAFDALPGRPDDYDYFRITAGPRRLADHIGGRTPSKSRIEVPASGHVSMAA